jgi:hypothetical protein
LRKGLAVLLVFALAASSLTILEPTLAQTILKPSKPEFSIKFVNASLTEININPYTGLNEVQLVDNNTIEIKINNQPWQHSDYQIYYNIRVKPSFGGNWTEIYPLRNLTSSYSNGIFTYAEYIPPEAPIMPNSGHTIINFPVVPTQYYGESGYDIQRYHLGDGTQEGHYFAFLHGIPYGGQLDFQVQALVGQNATYWYIMHPLFPQYGGFTESAIAYEGASSWSNTQTVSIGNNASNQLNPSPSESTFTPFNSSPNTFLSDNTQLTIIAATVAALAAVIVSLLLYIKRLKNK